MNKRQIKLSCYLEQLNIEVVKVEMILNQLNRLKNNQEIANYIIERDLLKTKCQLELSLASLCIILRKMCENQFITLNQERRKDINTFYQKVVRTFCKRTEKTPAHHPGTAMDKRQV